MPLLNCEMNLNVTWLANYFIVANPIKNQVPTSTLADATLYVLVVTLWSQGNTKLLQQLKSSFKRTID